MVKEKLSKKFFRFLASSNISVPSMLYYFFPAFEKQAISTHMNLVLGFYIPCSQGESRVSCFRHLFFRDYPSPFRLMLTPHEQSGCPISTFSLMRYLTMADMILQGTVGS
ncbi:hypothetical protein NC653_037355 [Populus alba x Populus x berolinensis]|uniref:Uncharacterized protein n=1 Tax=Populus alba x Populus x berolinensis TaxID=444605 RepID=A0AAD6PRZ3_9ROSI|nr:hypothetical protein NC653_037355 [Populus alba x Populus x berolinensis]